MQTALQPLAPVQTHMASVRSCGPLAAGLIGLHRDGDAVLIGALVRAKLQQLAWADATR